MSKTTIIGGALFGAACYAAAGLVFARKNEAKINTLAGGKVGQVSAVAQWPLWLWRLKRAESVAKGGDKLADAAKGAMSGSVAGVKV